VKGSCGGLDVKLESYFLPVVLVSTVLCLPVVAGEEDLLSTLVYVNIDSVHISLIPWGPHLGFESEIEGGDPRLKHLVALIRGAEPGGGHKCPNRGAVRFHMVGGSVIAVGLLPSHDKGIYEFRLYDGDRLQGVYRVQRVALLAAFEGLDVPVDDPAFAD
jgi:hypothetical protein